jgi:hypothetical protein
VKVLRNFFAMFGFARRRGLIDDNPCDKAAPRKTGNRNDHHLRVEEIGRPMSYVATATR